METKKAIKYFEDEVRFGERAPAGNIVQQTEDWTMTLEANRAALAALREKKARENPQPLTEDELRTMMGLPVWCVSENGARWFLVTKGLFTIINGVTAYRYKPGEANKIAQMTNAEEE